MYMYSKLFSGYDLVWCIPNISQPYCQDTKWSVSVWRLKSFVPGSSAANLSWPENIHGDLVIWGVNLDAYPGWWLTYPSEKYESQLGWWHSIYGKNKKCSKPPTSIIYMEEGYGFEEEKCLKKRLKNSWRFFRSQLGCKHAASLDASQVHPLGSALQKTPGSSSWSDLSQLCKSSYSPKRHMFFTCLSQSYHAMSAVAVVISESQAFVGCKKRTHYIWLVVDLPLWKIWKWVGMIIPNIWKNNQHIPNHQSDIDIWFPQYHVFILFGYTPRVHWLLAVPIIMSMWVCTTKGHSKPYHGWSSSSHEYIAYPCLLVEKPMGNLRSATYISLF